MNTRLFPAAAALALMSIGPAALAATDVSVAWNGNAAKTGVQLNAFDGNTKVFGGLATELSYSEVLTGGARDSFAAFCIEPLQSNTKLTATYSKSEFTGETGSLLAALYTTSYKTSATWGNTEQAAFQVAVWELTQQTGGLYDAGTGSFRVAGADSVVTLANSFLASATAFTGTSTYAIYKLTNSTYQDLITATKLDVPNTVVQVPEPQTYAMLLAGLGIVAFNARRRLPR
jgi:hypothetical protein